MAFLQSDRYWPEFCVLVERFDWLADERFADSAAASRQLRRAASSCSTSCSSSARSPSGRSCSPSRTASGTRCCAAGQVQHDDQALANGYVQRVEHDGDGKIVLVAAPVQFDGEPPALGKAPAFGADTDDVLRAHGRDDAAIADLRARGVIA